MDSLSLLVVAIGAVLVALVAYLGVIDYIHPVSEMKLSKIYARKIPKRNHLNAGQWFWKSGLSPQRASTFPRSLLTTGARRSGKRKPKDMLWAQMALPKETSTSWAEA